MVYERVGIGKPDPNVLCVNRLTSLAQNPAGGMTYPVRQRLFAERLAVSLDEQTQSVLSDI
jgi:hypothetical protein